MEELWVVFARDYPIHSDESMAGYLKRFYLWCAESDEARKRLIQLEKIVEMANTLLHKRRLLLEDGRPTEFATRDERDMLHQIGQAFQKRTEGPDDRLDRVEV